MTVLQRFWRNLIWQKDGVDETQPQAPAAQTAVPETTTLNIDIAPHDPLLTYVQHTSGAIDVQSLNLESTALQKLKEAGVKLIVPLVSQGELIGLINLGTRLSEQDYSSDDMRLLSSLATQAAPALRVAQLVRQQERQAAERERIAQELRVARLIQQTLLPQEVPQLAGWSVNAYYQPAREVGGDFYDFIHFPDGKIGFIVADVTDKGVPAALVMATTRSILHSAAERLGSPGAVLERTNDVLHPQIPPKMFVTCFYA
ncbi:MAG: SpoIIE family protein phosphatase, partial [Anaerolineales bacterium]|nr:SpoIIE family protein phosphatase [Anaerolineales bacterium]